MKEIGKNIWPYETVGKERRKKKKDKTKIPCYITLYNIQQESKNKIYERAKYQVLIRSLPLILLSLPLFSTPALLPPTSFHPSIPPPTLPPLPPPPPLPSPLLPSS